MYDCFLLSITSNPPKRGKEKSKEPAVIDISKTAYATPKNKFNLGTSFTPRLVIINTER